LIGICSKGRPSAENLNEKIYGRISHVKMAGGAVGDLSRGVEAL